jgi:hypothetical protein
MNRWRDTIIRLSTASDSINDAVLYTLLKRVGYSVVPSGSANGPMGYVCPPLARLNISTFTIQKTIGAFS